MPRRLRSNPKPSALEPRTSALRSLFAVVLLACNAIACSDGSPSGGQAGGGATSSGGTSGGSRDLRINQCGVAAPLPSTTVQCAAVTSPTITNFDDYAGTDAAGYTYYLNAQPPAAEALLGAIQHVGDGSDANGSIIATEMVPGRGSSGNALEFSNSNATNWGGLMMLYFPKGGTSPGCIDSSAYSGVEFWIKGASPSGKFGVSVNMLDTIPPSDGGSCDNAVADGCKNATLELALPPDAATWTKVQVPWSALTPGIGSGLSCVPVTGQNVVRLVIQPFMNYPPPNFTFSPGPYQLSIDDVGFYVESNTGGATLPPGGNPSCSLAPGVRWSGSGPLISPVSDATHDLLAVKDPTIVRYNERWHLYASSVSRSGAYSMIYTSFADFDEAATAPVYYMDKTPGFGGYTAAPQLFYFSPQKKWYLVFQSGPPMYSTNDDLADPTKWTPPAPFFPSTPATITKNGGGWLDFWVICDAASCHLFFSDNHGRWYDSKTSRADFPKGFSEPIEALHDANSGRVFEASNVYKMNGTNQYLALIEAFDQTSQNRRYFRSWIAESLDGPWIPWQASGSFPYAGGANVTFDAAAWTLDISHGDMVRAGYDETLAIDPCNMRYVFQGTDPLAETGGDYNKIPWRIGLLTQTP